MAIYSLLFGHAEWPEDKPSSTPLPPEYGERPRSRRLSVTVPDTLKRCVEESAALEGVPADAWIVRALSRSVDPRLLEVSR
jgi:hypothetical protein